MRLSIRLAIIGICSILVVTDIGGCATNIEKGSQSSTKISNSPQVNLLDKPQNNPYPETQKNLFTAMDMLDEFEQNNQDKYNISQTQLSRLIMADLYFNQGDVAKAGVLYEQLAVEIERPLLIYRAIICIELLPNTQKNQSQQLNKLTHLLIKQAPQATLSRIYAIKFELMADNYTVAQNELLKLIRANPTKQLAILQVLSSGLDNTHLLKVLKPLLTLKTPPDNWLQNLYVATLISNNEVNDAYNYLVAELNTGEVDNNLLVNLAVVETMLGKYNDSIKSLNQVKSASASLTSIINLTIGLLYDNQHNYSDAIDHYSRIHDAYSLESLAQAMLISDYYATKQYTELDKFLAAHAQKQHMSHLQSLLYQAATYATLTDYAKGYTLLKPHYATYSHNIDYLYQYASMATLSGHSIEAITLYKQLLNLDKKNVFAYNDLAYIYATTTANYKDALKYAKKAYQLAPLDPNVLDTLGFVYYQLQDYNKAYLYINASYTSYEQLADPNVANHLKAVLIALNKPESAKQIKVTDKDSLTIEFKQQLLARMIILLVTFQYGVDLQQ